MVVFTLHTIPGDLAWVCQTGSNANAVAINHWCIRAPFVSSRTLQLTSISLQLISAHYITTDDQCITLTCVASQLMVKSLQLTFKSLQLTVMALQVKLRHYNQQSGYYYNQLS